MSLCAFYADGGHAWEVGFERRVTGDSKPMWAISEAEHITGEYADYSFKPAKRCRCSLVVYQRDTAAAAAEILIGTSLL